MITKRHLGTVQKGKFKPHDAKAFRMAFYVCEGKEVAVTVTKYRKSRSDNQNRYLWGVVYKLVSESTGYTVDESHAAMKMLFLRVLGDGKKPDTVRSTKSLTTTEFEEYTENMRRWAAVEIGTFIPEPNEVEY